MNIDQVVKEYKPDAILTIEQGYTILSNHRLEVESEYHFKIYIMSIDKIIWKAEMVVFPFSSYIDTLLADDLFDHMLKQLKSDGLMIF